MECRGTGGHLGVSHANAPPRRRRQSFPNSPRGTRVYLQSRSIRAPYPRNSYRCHFASLHCCPFGQPVSLRSADPAHQQSKTVYFPIRICSSVATSLFLPYMGETSLPAVGSPDPARQARCPFRWCPAVFFS